MNSIAKKFEEHKNIFNNKDSNNLDNNYSSNPQVETHNQKKDNKIIKDNYNTEKGKIKYKKKLRNLNNLSNYKKL
jgi:hypothetical protein